MHVVALAQVGAWEPPALTAALPALCAMQPVSSMPCNQPQMPMAHTHQNTGLAGRSVQCPATTLSCPWHTHAPRYRPRKEVSALSCSGGLSNQQPMRESRRLRRAVGWQTLQEWSVRNGVSGRGMERGAQGLRLGAGHPVRPAAAATFTLQRCSARFQAAACRPSLAAPASQCKAEQRDGATSGQGSSSQVAQGRQV